MLKYAGTNNVKRESLPGVTGVGGTRTLRFEVIGPGEGNLELFLSRMDADQLETAVAAGKNVNQYIEKVIHIQAKEWAIDNLLTGGLDRFKEVELQE